MENDPFLTHGGQNRAAPRTGKGAYQQPRSGVLVGAVSLIALPELVFAVITCLYAFVYHRFPEVVVLAVVGFVALSIMFVTLDKSTRVEGRWYLFLGVLCFMATVMGTLYGLYNYHENFLQYEAYSANREYSNVLPSEPAAAHADAGKIEFSKSARIDTTKAVGFKQGDVYCVVPIMDDMQTSRVEYWAAGMNCCKQRADFQCDDAGSVDAHSGVVILDTNSFFPSNRDVYEKAVKEAEAAFDIVSSPNPLFVRWVKSPQEVQEMYLSSGWGYLLVGIAVYFLLSIILGAICHIQSGKKAHAAPRVGP